MTELEDIFGTGITQEATPGIQRIAKERMTRLHSFAVKSHTHMWTVIAQHSVSDDMLIAMDHGVAPVMDLDTLLGVYVGCYVCEEPYSPALRKRQCAGDPG